MVGEITLSVSIDASEAKKGASEFNRAADDIKKKAVEMGRAVERSSRAFQAMRAAADETSPAFSGSVRTLRVVETLQRTSNERVKSSSNAQFEQAGGFRKMADGQSLDASIGKINKATPLILTQIGHFLLWLERFIGALGAFFGLKEFFEKTREEERLQLERERQIAEDDAEAKALMRAAVSSSDPGFREFAKESALDRLGNAQALERENIAPLLEKERFAIENLEEFRRETGEDPRTIDPNEASFAARFYLESLRDIQEALETPQARIRERDETIAFLNRLPLDVAPQAGSMQKETIVPGDSTSQSAVDDDPIKQQIEDETRSIDLLKEKKTALEDATAAATAQKETELELLQREKECLERLNKALQDNQTLRGLTGDQSDDILEGAAAYDDLSTAIDENGEAAQGLKDQVGSLNTVLQSNADVNSQIVGGLNQEIDARQQVNGAIVERRRLEEEQRQRLIQADDETERRGKAVEASIEQIKDAAKDSFKDVIKGTESIGDAFQKLADRITDILLDLALDELLKGGTGFSDLFGTIFGGIGSIFGGGAPANLAGPAGIGILPIGHQGGVIGQDRFPLRRFHQGGFPGLRPDEIPLIAQRGEEILARGDPRNAANNNGALGGNVVVNVTFPNARNTDEARQAGSEIAAMAA